MPRNFKDLEEYRAYVQEKLARLRPLFARTATGDYSMNLEVLNEDEEFIELYTGIQIMLEVIRKQLSDLHALNASLEEKMTELKRVSDLQLKQEREIRRLRERFVFVAAHELKSPLTAIEWGLSSILGDIDILARLPQSILSTLETIDKKTKTLIALATDLLHVGRMQEQTQARSSSEKINFQNIVEDIATTLRPLADEQSITVTWPEKGKTLPALGARATALKEVLSNLVSNAIRYNKKGGTVTVSAEQEGDFLNIHVIDTGVGISSEHQEHLFEEFYRIKDPKAEAIDGTGLGLFISKQLVERMGGKIWVESQTDVGSTFSFSVPVFKG